jgi:hypothetical protein
MAGRGPGDRADRVAAAAADLYGLPPGEFTAARAERAGQARADGDRPAAAVIAKLPKPNVVAWLANQLARRHPGEIGSLLELGGALRQATADLDAARLGQLSRQQRQIVSGLLGQARELGAEAGQAVSGGTARGLEDTLHAALADEAAGQELARGQLAAGLLRTGFAGIDDAAAAAAAHTATPRTRTPSAAADRGSRTGQVAEPDPTPGSAAPAAKRPPGRRGEKAAASERTTKAPAGQRDAKSAADRRARAAADRRAKAAADRQAEAARAAAEARRQQRDQARQAEEDSRREAEEAGRDRNQAQAALADAESAAQAAEATVDRLQRELDAALDARNNAGRAQRQARKEADRADRTASQAERRLAEATTRRADLEQRGD